MAAAALGRGVGLGGGLIGVERHAHGAVADRVRHHLPAALVEHRDDLVQLLGREARVALDRRAIGVGLEHRGGVRFDDAVGDQLDRAGLEHGIVGEARAHLVELVEAGFGERGVRAKGLIDAQRQLAALAQAIEELEIGGGAAGVLHAGDADAMRFVDRGADRREAIFFGGFRRRRGHQRHRGFLQRAGRFARARILHDHAVGGSLGAAVDARGFNAFVFAQPVWPS